jgi:HAD superfamily hydrolase (TIGR01450 family)
MLGYILEALTHNNVTDIVVCVGYKSEQIVNFCTTHFPQLIFTFIENKRFDETHNMYSLYLARKHFNEDVLLMNADLVFDPEVITELLKTKGSCIAVDIGRYLEEAMKIVVEDGVITSISKKITPKSTYGSSIDVYRLEITDLHIVNQELKRIIERDGDENQWTEVLLDNLFKTGKLKAKPMSIGKSRWYEIDNFEDLAQAEILFNSKLPQLKNKKAFFSDRDGTLTIESGKIQGSDEFITRLKKNKKHLYIMTNNSSKTKVQHWKTFKSKDLPVKQQDVLVSLDASLIYLTKAGYQRVYWVANRSVSAHIRKQGFIFDKTKPDALLLTWDTQLTYAKLRQMCQLVQLGLPYFATHLDMVCPTAEGPIPDIGTIIKVIEFTTERIPDKVFGKPNREFIDPVISGLGLKEEEVVVIGDRLYTDIQIAQNSKITSILVLSGETSRADYEFSDIRADIIVPSVKDLLPFLR